LELFGGPKAKTEEKKVSDVFNELDNEGKIGEKKIEIPTAEVV